MAVRAESSAQVLLLSAYAVHAYFLDLVQQIAFPLVERFDLFIGEPGRAIPTDQIALLQLHIHQSMGRLDDIILFSLAQRLATIFGAEAKTGQLTLA